jgi:hypothetical protein
MPASAPTGPYRLTPPAPVLTAGVPTQTTTPSRYATADPSRAVTVDFPTGSLDLDEHILISGYLAAVAACLDQRDVMVRQLRAINPRRGPLRGVITLDRPSRIRTQWIPTGLTWEEGRGWSATLSPVHPESSVWGQREVSRYLPRQLVPAPEVVAHFVEALNTDEHTVWACSSFREPHLVDRRWLILQLSRFAMPEPW